jgi:hypothetical protein
MGTSPLISGLFHDGPAIEALDAMDLAGTSIGNHELDDGPTELLHRIEGARYQYLAANIGQDRNAGGLNILQISEGFTCRYWLHAPAGQHVVGRIDHASWPPYRPAGTSLSARSMWMRSRITFRHTPRWRLGRGTGSCASIDSTAMPVPATEQARKTAQPASTEYAQSRCFACRLNLRLPHHFKPLPGSSCTIFFSLAPLIVKERILFPLLAALLTARLRHRHKSIIARAGAAALVSRKNRSVTLSSSARRLIISNDDPATEPFQQ